ncbi:MAG TPA: carboxypeptidase-like regulatory domain-containing protein [Roseiflexaceae bacterium]|nr:carboxypeptidase-like regulatory domain-containing protein [Roseiflexaceae bacterium]
MPRHIALAIYSAVFGVALLAGLLIAAVLLPNSLPSANLVIRKPTSAPATRTPANTGPTSPGLGQVAAQMVSAARSAPRETSSTSIALASTSIPPTQTPEPTVTAIPTETPVPTATEAPAPTAAPALVFATRIFDKPTDAAVSCGTTFESRIWGVVKNRAGRGIGRAVVQVNSADGKNRYRATTNSQGGFEVPGLGCTAWIVRLVSVPGAPSGIQTSAVRVGLNGGRYTGAGIEFRQR